jgi:chromosome segregation ATPase
MSNEVAVALIGAIATVATGTIGLVIRKFFARLAASDRRIQQALSDERKLREQGDRRTTELETQLKLQGGELFQAKARVLELEDGQGTLIKQLKDVQTRLSTTEEKLDAKEQEVVRLRQERDEAREDCRTTRRENEVLTVQVKTYQTALSLVGERLEQHISADKSGTDSGPGESTIRLEA